MKKIRIIITTTCVILFVLIVATVIIFVIKSKNEASEISASTRESIPSNTTDEYSSESVLTTLTESPTETSNASKTHIVTFLGREGEIIATQSVKDGGNAVPPEAPECEGYFFLKWDKSVLNVRSDIEIRALYTATKNPAFAIDNIYVDLSKSTVEVPIRIINNPGLSSCFLYVSYDSILVLENVEFEREFGQYTTAPIPFGNPQSISVISPFSDINYSGIFATLTFKIINAPDVGDDYRAVIRVSYDADNTFNSDYEDVWFDVIDGSVNIID